MTSPYTISLKKYLNLNFCIWQHQRIFVPPYLEMLHYNYPFKFIRIVRKEGKILGASFLNKWVGIL